METSSCGICGDELSSEYSHKLDCGHELHYQCLLLSFKKGRHNICPYCRAPKNKLPLVNGTKKFIPNIHIPDDSYINTPCKAVIQKGKNKGSICNKQCQLGFEYCRTHNKKFLK